MERPCWLALDREACSFLSEKPIDFYAADEPVRESVCVCVCVSVCVCVCVRVCVCVCVSHL